jgi:heme a synthase
MALKFHWITLLVIYLVVVAGSIVRMTGSGMGCPDWPKCFDQYIPPTDASDLPDNYQDYYSLKREKKIKKFSSFLKSIGLEGKANILQNDKSLLIEQPFNVWNTWTEYLNRLIGALAGLFIIGGLVISLFAKSQRPKKLILCSLLLILTLFQAWWGAMVVATNIVPWVLTVHMILAAFMIGLQIVIIEQWTTQKKSIPSALRNLAFLGILILTIQIIIGTQVRQHVDEWLTSNSRDTFIFTQIVDFISHRTVALALVIYVLLLTFFNYLKKVHSKIVYAIFILIIFEAITGKILADYCLPLFLQPFHLLFALLLFGLLSRFVVNSEKS